MPVQPRPLPDRSRDRHCHETFGQAWLQLARTTPPRGAWRSGFGSFDPDSVRSLVVSSSYPPDGWGGAELAAEGIARWMTANGHEVGVYADSGMPSALTVGPARSGHRYSPAKRWWSHRTSEHGLQSTPRKAIWHLADHFPHQGAREFGKVVSAFRPDLVMVHLAPGFGIGLFEYCARNDIPVVFVVHDFWITCLRSSMFSRTGLVCTKRELSCRWSSSIRWGALSRIPRLGFWAPSGKIVEIVSRELGTKLPNTLVEKNVVDLSDFAGLSSQAPPGPPSLLYLGKVTAAKGVDFVLDCLRSLPRNAEFSVDVVGSGDREAPLRRLLADDGRFRFHGARPRDEVRTLYRRASALLVPSIWFENSPMVIYQAQAAGLPVLASDSGGIPELLAGRDDSIILPAGDAAAWTSSLRRLVEDRSLLARLRASAAAYAAESESTLDARGRRVMKFCESIIGSKSTMTGR
jgi:glycosyltransferase involved in cell wall biosynthesis